MDINFCIMFTASTVVDVEVTSIFRQLDIETKLYLEYFVPDDGFTIQVELDIGRVVVCGSNSLERPDCSYSLTYDWRLEISEYEELFIRPDGFPSNTPVPTHGTPTPTSAPTQAGTLPTTSVPNSTQANSNVTVYLTIEGLDDNNVFSLNTTFGDTRAPEGMHLRIGQGCPKILRGNNSPLLQTLFWHVWFESTLFTPPTT